MILVSCTNKSDKTQDNNTETDSTVVVDYEGVYTGTLPCADCSGIYTEITLKGDKYTIKTTYEGKEPNNTFEENGTFTLNKDNNTITLNGDSMNRYKVEEKRIIALDADGNIIKGDLANMYILNKK